MKPGEMFSRIAACMQCPAQCAAFLADKKWPMVSASTCALSRWPKTPAAGLVRSTADEHEIVAAQAGHVASCCGRPDLTAAG